MTCSLDHYMKLCEESLDENKYLGICDAVDTLNKKIPAEQCVYILNYVYPVCIYNEIYAEARLVLHSDVLKRLKKVLNGPNAVQVYKLLKDYLPAYSLQTACIKSLHVFANDYVIHYFVVGRYKLAWTESGMALTSEKKKELLNTYAVCEIANMNAYRLYENFLRRMNMDFICSKGSGRIAIGSRYKRF
jgi:hypothetical protein